MIERIKKRLIRFQTDGKSIVSDFVAARQKKAALLRRIIHICFYSQCAAAVICAITGFMISGMAAVMLCIAAVAVIGAAFFALGGGFALKTVSYILNMVYSVICFVIGGAGLYVCGALMLIAALAALLGFAAGYFRAFLLEYSPTSITSEDYTLIRKSHPLLRADEEEAPPTPPEPEPPKKSELLLLAEQVMMVMDRPVQTPLGTTSAQVSEQAPTESKPNENT